MSQTTTLPSEPTAIAPDGSEVRVLLATDQGGMAHFELAPQATSVAVEHRTVSEIWYFLGGAGQMWRSFDGEATVVDVAPGVCITIPVGTRFQFRSLSDEPLAALGCTMPPWPGAGEAMIVDGMWEPTVAPGPG